MWQEQSTTVGTAPLRVAGDLWCGTVLSESLAARGRECGGGSRDGYLKSRNNLEPEKTLLSPRFCSAGEAVPALRCARRHRPAVEQQVEL